MRALQQFATRFMRLAYYRAQDHKCGICQQKMQRKGIPAGDKFGFDHVWPSSKLSARDLIGFHGNLLLCHKGCNTDKGAKLPTDKQLDFLRATNRRLGLPAHETAIWDSPREDHIHEQKHQQCGDAAAQRAEAIPR